MTDTQLEQVTRAIFPEEKWPVFSLEKTSAVYDPRPTIQLSDAEIREYESICDAYEFWQKRFADVYYGRK